MVVNVSKMIPVKNGNVLVQSTCPMCKNTNVHQVGIENGDTAHLVICDSEESAGCGKRYVIDVSFHMTATVCSATIQF